MVTCKAADPNTRTPRFRVPPNTCDAHCHVFGPAERYPYAPDRSYTPPDAPLATFQALQRALGVDRAVLVNASCHGLDNQPVLDAIAESGGRYRGVANIDDNLSAGALRALDDCGIRGCRFNFVRHLGGVPDMSVFDRVVRQIAPLGWHLVLHFDAQDLLVYADILAKLPVIYIIDHMGRVKAGEGLDQEPFRILLGLLARDPKCWVKVCGAERISSKGAPFTDAVPFAARLIETAPDRVLWGTDWPHPNIKGDMPNDGDLVDLIPLFAPSAELQRKLLVDNPA
ncbi:MAG: amidohydrolase family protein, partial [Methylobacteriaceae bacterium]|nr:amidohydrolase family protein [Methylobacteriaceae bacterium]